MAERILESIKDIPDITAGLADIPVVIIPLRGERADRSRFDTKKKEGRDNFFEHLKKDEPNHFGTNEIPWMVIADQPSAHTLLTIEDPEEPGRNIYGHFLLYVNKPTTIRGGKEEGPVNFDTKVVAGKAEQALTYLYNKTGQDVFVYQLIGKNDRPDLGLGQGSSSNDLYHLQLTASFKPDDINQKTFAEFKPDPLDRQKQALKFSGVTNRIVERIFLPLISECLGNGARLEICETRKNPLLKGVSLVLDSTDLADYLDVTNSLINKFNQIYEVLFATGKEIYCSDPKAKEQIINSGKEKLAGIGISEKLSGNLLRMIDLFNPTFAQVESWLKEPGLDPKAKEKLEKRKTKYLKFKTALEKVTAEDGTKVFRDPKMASRIKNILDTNDLGLEFIRQQLGLSGKQGAELAPDLTLCPNPSWRWEASDIKFTQKGCEIHGIKIFPQTFGLGGNTIENLLGIMVDRQM